MLKKPTESRENLVRSAGSLASTMAGDGGDAEADNRSLKSSVSVFDREVPDIILTQTEKKFLLSAERGDCATVRRYGGIKGDYRVFSRDGIVL